ncbi:MAG: hypothetical protein LUQ09_08500, partial [Methanomassiliicoccales archaeon]|nr:hypothetical protein [Methanomassiliicoccales archaeon]
MTIIQGNADLLNMKLGEDDKLRKYADNINSASVRASDMV